jgi:AcrR family transcriptional regulator
MVSEVRERLVEGGMRILERDGLQALSVRSLAAEVGTSTMAVYTHFGGMTGVIDALADEAFARFTRVLTDAEQTDDPVRDFFVMGAAYRAFALADPQRYQLIFGIASPASVVGQRTDVTSTGNATGRADQAESFGALRHAVRRMIASGRIRDDGEVTVAGRLWSLVHGAVMLELAGFFGHEGHGLTHVLTPLTVDCIVGLGDERTSTLQSLASATQALDRTG